MAHKYVKKKMFYIPNKRQKESDKWWHRCGEKGALNIDFWGMQVSTVAMGSSMGLLQEIKNRTTLCSRNPTSGSVARGNKIHIPNTYCTPCLLQHHV